MTTTTTPTDANISILRIGPSGPSTTILKNALLSYFDCLEEEEHNNNDDDVLVLSNKYFTARVQLLELGAPNPHERKEDGLILVFDGLASNPDRGIATATATTFDALHHYLTTTTTEHTVENNGDYLLKLCVGVVVQSGLIASDWRGKSTEETEYSRRILWCLDHELEYVEADLSQEGQTMGHDVRDKDGFARVVEAIEGTVWSSANMGEKIEKKKKRETANTAANNKEEQQQQDTNNNTNNTIIKDGTYEPPSTFNYGGALSVAEPTFMEEERGGEGEEEEEATKLDNLEGLIRQASDFREQAKSGNLPDDVRRQRAADFVLNLMGSLGIDDDDDDDENDDSSSDEEEEQQEQRQKEQES